MDNVVNAWMNVREPTFEESRSFWEDGPEQVLHRIILWSGLKGDPLDVNSEAGSLLILTGIRNCPIDDDGLYISLGEAASLCPQGFDSMLPKWEYTSASGRSMTSESPGRLTAEMRARSLLRAAAIAAGNTWSRSAQRNFDQEARQEEARQYEHQAPPPSALDKESQDALAILLTARAEELVDAKKTHVLLSKTVEATNDRVVPIMTLAEYNACWDRFKKKMDREPTPAETPSRAQLTAVRDQVMTEGGNAYVDISMFGPNHVRTQKSHKYMAQIIVNGVPQEVEMKGPPDFETWKECWLVYQCCMIMLAACKYNYLNSYATMIEGFNTTWCMINKKCWGLLYQSDNRFRHEHFVVMLRREEALMEKHLLRQTHDPDVHMDCAKPFQHLYRLATTVRPEGSEEREWWTNNFKDHAMKVTYGLSNVSAFIDGDAAVAASRALHFPTAGAPDSANDTGGGGGGHNKPLKVKKVQMKQEQFSDEVCKRFNLGQCPTGKGGRCAKNGKYLHRCGVCGANTHTSTHHDKPAKKGKGGKKGGAKSGKKGDAVNGPDGTPWR